MIIVVEGISAAGKTTWCNRYAQDCLVPETFPLDRKNQPLNGREVAAYWTDWNVYRWSCATEVERRKGQAVCDTDPLKLHYIWSLCAIGEARVEQWQMQLAATREAFYQKRIGFADLYCVKIIDPAVARLQYEKDKERIRDRFDLHVKLQEPLLNWYGKLDPLLPGRVVWQLPDDLPQARCDETSLHRYDKELFDEFISALGEPL